MDQDVVVSTATKQEHALTSTRTFPPPDPPTHTSIPPEILLHIFSYAIFSCPHSITSPRNSALSLSRVCSSWRTLVVQTGAFWTRITIDYGDGIPNSVDSAQAVLVWLSRTGQTRPLDVTFFVSEEMAAEQSHRNSRMNETAAVLAPSHKQWRSFSCCISDSLLARLLPFERVRGNIFCSRFSRPFDLPILESLEISTFMGDSRWPCTDTPDLILHSFTASPALTSVSFPRHDSSLRVGIFPWAQLRRLHLNSPDNTLFHYGTLELTQALVQCCMLEDLVLNLDSMGDGGANEPLPPFISPRHPLPFLRIMSVIICGYSCIAPMHLVGSITAPSLATLSVSGREELDEDSLSMLGRSDEEEDNVAEIHRVFCHSLVALLQASDTRLSELHFTSFYADTESIWALFGAAADTLDIVSFRHGRSVVLDSMHNPPASHHHIRWLVDSDESLGTNDPFAELTEIDEYPAIVFRHVWPSGDPRAG